MRETLIQRVTIAGEYLGEAEQIELAHLVGGFTPTLHPNAIWVDDDGRIVKEPSYTIETVHPSLLCQREALDVLRGWARGIGEQAIVWTRTGHGVTVGGVENV